MAAVAPEYAGKHGLHIESLNFNNAQDVLTALISGQLDIALLTPAHLMRAVDTKIDVVQISGNTRGNTGIIAAKGLGLKENDWDGFTALIKKKMPKIASSRGSVNELLAIATFAKHGINYQRDIDLVNIANFAQHPQALRSGDFDMIITLEPLAALTVAEGVGTLFSHPYDSKAGDLNTNYVVQRDFLNAHKAQAKAFVETLADAAKYLSNKDNELKVAERLTGLKPEVLKTALANNRYELSNGLAEMQEMAHLAADLHFTSRDVAKDLPKAVDNEFLKEVGVSK